MPSTVSPGIPYATERTEMGVTADIVLAGPDMPYWLFSQINTTGSFQIEAMFSDS